MTRTALVVLLLLVSPALVPAAETSVEPGVTLEGQVFDASGAPVADSPVRVLMTRRLVALKDLSLRDEFAEGPATRTDDQGFFRIDLRPDPGYDYFYLRFYDRTGYDAVRYALPADEDVTRALRAGRSVIVQRRLDDAPQWAEVERELHRVGGVRTPRGRLLRTIGLPDQVVPRSGGVTEWRYEKAGVSYLIQDGEVIERAALGAPGTAAP